MIHVYAEFAKSSLLNTKNNSIQNWKLQRRKNSPYYVTINFLWVFWVDIEVSKVSSNQRNLPKEQ